MSKIVMTEQSSAPDTPGSGKVAIYVDTDGSLCWRKDDGVIVKIASAGTYTLTIPATGTAALLGTAQTFSAAQTFSNVLTAPGIKPASNSTTAIQLQNAGGTAVLTVDTTNGVVIASNRYDALGSFRTVSLQIADDVAIDLRALYTNVPTAGVLLMSVGQSLNSAGLLHYRAANSPFCGIIAQPSNDIVTGTTALTNGTSDGTDGKINVAATSSGELFIKNRRGNSYTFVLTVFA